MTNDIMYYDVTDNDWVAKCPSNNRWEMMSLEKIIYNEITEFYSLKEFNDMVLDNNIDIGSQPIL